LTGSACPETGRVVNLIIIVFPFFFSIRYNSRFNRPFGKAEIPIVIEKGWMSLSDGAESDREILGTSP
jgi:hypothetical protein